MARPKPDVDKIRGRLIEAAEAMLQETDGQRLILSEVARRVGLSQSHAHSFFATKNDLIGALAENWFAEVEAAVSNPVGDTMADQLETYVLTILRLKRDRFDANPILFQAYLNLARGHMDIVHGHTQNLRRTLQDILVAEIPPDRIDAATDMVWDATTAFRVPHMIALSRHTATDQRARQVVRACLAALRAGEPSS